MLMGKRRLATEREVMETFTEIMRGEMTEESDRKGETVLLRPKISERCKAAELLGKQMGLFDRKEEMKKTAISDELMALLESMHGEA